MDQDTPRPPTAFLPSLARMRTHSQEHISKALDELKKLYWPALALSADLSAIALDPCDCKYDPAKANIAPTDSGYASAEDEDAAPEPPRPKVLVGGVASPSLSPTEGEVIRLDLFERAFAIKWLTGLIARFDDWVEVVKPDDNDPIRLFEFAAEVLSAFTRDDSLENGNDNDDGEEDGDAITRPFVFPVFSTASGKIQAGEVRIELQDRALSDSDHTCVGLQSWGSAILMSEMICADVGRFFGASTTYGIDCKAHHGLQRVLELGAGTGMLSILTSKLVGQAYMPHHSSGNGHSGPGVWEVVATDYHPDVLANLKKNLEANLDSRSSTTSDLDSKPKFDLIFAADVIYHPEHPTMIKGCVEKMLKVGGVFWMMVALRKTGRHDGLEEVVDECFKPGVVDADELASCHPGWRLVVLEREEIVRGTERRGLGRADESGYVLYKIGWI